MPGAVCPRQRGLRRVDGLTTHPCVAIPTAQGQCTPDDDPIGVIFINIFFIDRRHLIIIIIAVVVVHRCSHHHHRLFVVVFTITLS